MNDFVRKASYASSGLWQGSSPRLGRVDIELTERCNNACRHCYINLPSQDVEAQRSELSTEEVERFLRETAAAGALAVSFTGGEPLLRQDFERLYLTARRLGLQVMIATNAVLITEGLADLFAHVPPLLPIRITVYGMSEESYEAVSSVKGSYGRFLEGVAHLEERGVPIELVGTALHQVSEEVTDLDAWAADIVDAEGPPGLITFLYLRAHRDSCAKNDVIRGLRREPEEAIAFLSTHRPHYINGLREMCQRIMAPAGDVLFDCGAGHSVSLGASGFLHPCLSLHSPETSYDWRHGSLQEALEDFFVRLRTRTATDPEYLLRCARCFLHGLCEQCPAWSWPEHGTLDTPVDYVCRVAHAQARRLGLLREGERAWEIEAWKERLQWM